MKNIILIIMIFKIIRNLMSLEFQELINNYKNRTKQDLFRITIFK